MQSLLDLQPGENVRAILPVRDLEEEGKFIFFATQKGTVKKTPLKDFSNVMARGIIAIGIDKDDELVAARITDGYADRLPRHAPRHGHPLRRERRALHGPPGLRRARHRARQERLRRRRRRHAQGARAGRLPHSLRHRERLRQAHRCRGVPPADARRQGRQEHGRHRAHRPRQHHSAGRRHLAS